MSRVDEAFGLTRAAYFTMPRLVMESMPDDWQERFVALIEEAHTAFVFDTAPYDVRLRDASTKRFVSDPLADYRRGRVVPRILASGGRAAKGETT